MKRVAILQSCYIPWKGYFDLINSVDEFILFDDSQYTRQDWRNRNRIKTAHGPRWLTIPVRVDGLYQQRLNETYVADPNWASRHWDIVRQAYRKVPHFTDVAEEIEAAYKTCSSERRLSAINRSLLESVCRLLGINTKLSWSTDYAATGSRTERVVSLCEQADAGVYLSGPRGRDYIDEQLFERKGIGLLYFDYDGYPTYPQPHPPFEHKVTILDLLFSTGAEAPRFMKSFGAAVGTRG
jgi:hypothetical protein